MSNNTTATPPATDSEHPGRIRLIGAEESPYSVKVRSYLRYKKLPHDWLTRTQAGSDYQRYATVPLIPLLITTDGRGLQDSTPIIETLESEHPSPSIHPDDPTCRFLSFLLEEFADEWGNKWMFHYRWAREADQLACSRRLAEMMSPDADDEALTSAAVAIRERMVDRVWFVGSSPQTAQQIEDSFKDTLTLLEPHFASHAFLFGQRPAFADFALWGQIYNAHRDPTPGGIIRLHAPNTLKWIERMQTPEGLGEFAPWAELSKTLQPLLSDQVADLFLTWSNANASAIAEKADSFSVRLRHHEWTQRPQKYHARSLAALKSRYTEFSAEPNLKEVLKATGCLSLLT